MAGKRKKPNKSEQKGRGFRWDKTREESALLIARGEVSDSQIAERLGIGRTTLWEWRTHPEFEARVEAHIADLCAQVRRRGIAIREHRVRALQDRWERMNRVMADRGADAKMQDVPGGTTGLLVHDVKSVGGGTGETGSRVDLYSVDTALLKELREHEKQAAQELGQWTDKQDVTSNGQSLIQLVDRPTFNKV